MAPTNVASAPATLVAMVTTASATPQKLAVQNLTKSACEYLSYVFLQAKHPPPTQLISVTLKITLFGAEFHLKGVYYRHIGLS